jgi:hypothetical protein
MQNAAPTIVPIAATSEEVRLIRYSSRYAIVGTARSAVLGEGPDRALRRAVLNLLRSERSFRGAAGAPAGLAAGLASRSSGVARRPHSAKLGPSAHHLSWCFSGSTFWGLGRYRDRGTSRPAGARAATRDRNEPLEKDEQWSSRRTRLTLGQADAAERRIDVERVGRRAVACTPPLVVEQIGGDDLEVVVGRVREGAAAVTVAERPDAGDVRREVVADRDVPTHVRLDARRLKREVVGVRAAPHGEQDLRAD